MQIKQRELNHIKSQISELEKKVFSIEKSHGNRNKSITSEMDPVNSIINDGKSLQEVHTTPKNILCSECNVCADIEMQTFAWR